MTNMYIYIYALLVLVIVIIEILHYKERKRYVEMLYSRNYPEYKAGEKPAKKSEFHNLFKKKGGE